MIECAKIVGMVSSMRILLFADLVLQFGYMFADVL